MLLMMVMSAREPFSVSCRLFTLLKGGNNLQKDENLVHFDILHNQHYHIIAVWLKMVGVEEAKALDMK